MKNILLLLLVSCLLVSSCATRKYGCKLTSTKQTYIGINPNYVPARKSICRGHGRVSPISDGIYMIKIEGILIKDDTTITEAKYVIVYGNFAKTLQSYNGKIISFECKTVFPNIYVPAEMVEVAEGCVENGYNYVAPDGTIVFNKI